MRLFVALPIPLYLMAPLEALQDGLEDCHLVDPDGFHITLAFLGDVDGATARDVGDALMRVKVPHLRLRTRGLNVFGGEKPRIIHLDIAPDQTLSDLRRRVVTACHGAGVAIPHSKFHPHITLARRKASPLTPALDRALRVGASADPGEIIIDDMALYESHLTTHGPVYHLLALYPQDAEAV